MSSLKNSVRLMGFLGNDPEIKNFGDDKSLARVALATNSNYKNKADEWVTDTQWHTIVMWESNARFAKTHLKKGSEVAIEGKLVNRSYTDKDGITRYFTEVVVNELVLITKKEISE